MKIRIKIEKLPEYQHILNITAETHNLNKTIGNIKKFLYDEICKREEELIKNIESEGVIDKILKLEKDLIDWQSKGKDINKKEYIINQVEHEIKS